MGGLISRRHDRESEPRCYPRSGGCGGGQLGGVNVGGRVDERGRRGLAAREGASMRPVQVWVMAGLAGVVLSGTAPAPSGRSASALRADEAAVTSTLSMLGQGFTRTETDHFVILSDCDRAWTQARAGMLERANHQFTRFMERLEREPGALDAKLQVVLINDHAAYAAFARTRDGVTAPWVAGYYAAFTNRAVFYNDATAPVHPEPGPSRASAAPSIAPRQARAAEGEAASITTAKTLHEAIHLVAFNRGLQSRARQAPFWLTEGLACSFESDQPTRSLGPDRPVKEREEEFDAVVEKGALIPLEALVAMNHAPEDDVSVSAMYAQSYMLFRHLFRHKREQLAAYFDDLNNEPPGFASPRRHSEMFEARFGDPRAVEKALMRAWQRERGRGDRAEQGR